MSVLKSEMLHVQQLLNSDTKVLGHLQLKASVGRDFVFL